MAEDKKTHKEERKEYIRFYMENAHALASSFEEFFPMVEECYDIRMKKRKY